MARKAILLLILFAVPLLSGCIQYESSNSYESPDGCWMFCGGGTEYNTFIWFPMMIVLMLVVGIVIAVVAASGNNKPPQQQVVIHKDEKD